MIPDAKEYEVLLFWTGMLLFFNTVGGMLSVYNFYHGHEQPEVKVPAYAGRNLFASAMYIGHVIVFSAWMMKI